jgi:hypothetical protein
MDVVSRDVYEPLKVRSRLCRWWLIQLRASEAATAAKAGPLWAAYVGHAGAKKGVAQREQGSSDGAEWYDA